MLDSSDLSDSGVEVTNNISPQLNHLPKASQFVENLKVPPPEAGLTKLGYFIAKACNEQQTSIIIKATHVLGREAALRYVEFALRTQKSNAGYLIKDGSRLRTLGGLFLRLIKDDPCIDPYYVKLIFKKTKPKIAKQRYNVNVNIAKQRYNVNVNIAKQHDHNYHNSYQMQQTASNFQWNKTIHKAVINPFANEPDSKKPLFLCTK